ncbi:DsbA family protein [Methylocella silvestris]|uniref:Disulfide bond formation protein DsbA n=1 Tax=Methylocella silvestris TaxID=199596 RepID=A0A2J7TMQ0_METSI|nr:DsbA family protein [Methylocella silvestris]PNG28041.1 disulfide bond formation protein DsbA [Methylocella silvestris]
MAKVSRRGVLVAAAMVVCVGAAAAPLAADDPDLSREALLSDPATPVGGDPNGDVTIVAFFDYNCPFCMKSEPALEQLMASDKHVRLVYKDWPIFGGVSVYAAKLALAANFQGKYAAAHHALMATSRRKSSEAEARQLVAAAGVDMARLDADLAGKAAEIDAILKRTDKQATGMSFAGTPVYLIGPFLVAAALDLDGFKKAVADARAKRAP